MFITFEHRNLSTVFNYYIFAHGSMLIPKIHHDALNLKNRKPCKN